MGLKGFIQQLEINCWDLEALSNLSMDTWYTYLTVIRRKMCVH